eukprot:c6831_g1_i1.p1 GENE.c6831_g1_i1~~c6831_g1_i1.p1  ORF type:complete len:453 (+),score=66.93 c6831_g1_i1:94-1359(+)
MMPSSARQSARNSVSSQSLADPMSARSNPAPATSDYSNLVFTNNNGSARVVTFDDLLHVSRSRLRPFWPKRVIYDDKGQARIRSTAELIYIGMTNTQQCEVAFHFVMFTMVLIVMSCFLGVLETTFLQYSPECEKCAPLTGENLRNPEKIAARESLASECNDCEPGPLDVFVHLESFLSIMFSLEYLARFLTAHSAHHLIPEPPSDPDSPTAPSRRLTWSLGLRRTVKFMIDPLNVIDLIVVVPFYIGLVAPSTRSTTFAGLRVLRFFRLLRAAKFGRFTDGVILFLRVMRNSALAFLIFAVFAAFGMIVIGSLVYLVERGKWDPKTGLFLRRAAGQVVLHEPSPFTSIPQSFWWVLVTFTSVGYGDMVPATGLGQFIGVIAMYFGASFLASFAFDLVCRCFVGDDADFNHGSQLRRRVPK